MESGVSREIAGGYLYTFEAVRKIKLYQVVGSEYDRKISTLDGKIILSTAIIFVALIMAGALSDLEYQISKESEYR